MQIAYKVHTVMYEHEKKKKMIGEATETEEEEWSTGITIVGRSTRRKRMTSCLYVYRKTTAVHEEFERLVHAATFLSRGEYKSTRRLPCYAQRSSRAGVGSTGHGTFTLRTFLRPCLSIHLSVGVIERTRARE